MPAVDDDFAGPLDPRWRRWAPGGGEVAIADSALRLALSASHTGRYSNAQIDDYSGQRHAHFNWRPPLRLSVRARFSHPPSDLHGTAGFGFWNNPLTVAGGAPRLPDAVWFFAASPPSNMALVPGVAGWGWKAQIVHAQRIGALLAAGPMLGAAGWARLTGRDEPASRWLQRLTGAQEATLAIDPCDWHDYALEWRRGEARFWVDGAPVLTAPQPPRGPLGFVAWLDNQFAVASPRGVLRFGTLDGAARQLELERLVISAT